MVPGGWQVDLEIEVGILFFLIDGTVDSFVVVGNIDELLVIHETEAKPIEPTAAPEHIPLYARVSIKVDRCRGLGAENLNRDFVSICLKSTVGCRICFVGALFDP